MTDDENSRSSVESYSTATDGIAEPQQEQEPQHEVGPQPDVGPQPKGNVVQLQPPQPKPVGVVEPFFALQRCTSSSSNALASTRRNSQSSTLSLDAPDLAGSADTNDDSNSSDRPISLFDDDSTSVSSTETGERRFRVYREDNP